MPFTKKPLCDKKYIKTFKFLSTTNCITKTKTKHLLGLLCPGLSNWICIPGTHYLVLC